MNYYLGMQVNAILMDAETICCSMVLSKTYHFPHANFHNLLSIESGEIVLQLSGLLSL